MLVVPEFYQPGSGVYVWGSLSCTEVHLEHGRLPNGGYPQDPTLQSCSPALSMFLHKSYPRPLEELVSSFLGALGTCVLCILIQV